MSPNAQWKKRELVVGDVTRLVGLWLTRQPNLKKKEKKGNLREKSREMTFFF
jgi:hypothetical protein